MRSKTNSHRTSWPLSVVFVFLILILFSSGAHATIYDVYGKYLDGATEESPLGAFWPGDGEWRAVSSLGDPDDSLPEWLDFVGDSYSGGPGGTNYAFFTYSGAYDVGDGYGSQYYAYFRLRVDEGTFTAGDWADTISIMIDGDANGTTDYALAWDTKGEDAGVVHGLEFQVVKTDAATWGGTDFDDVDKDMGKKLVNWTTCDTGKGCWYVDIPYVAWLYEPDATTDYYFAGFMRVVDGQSAGIWGTTMFIDVAVSWDYLIAASTAAHGKSSSLPILSSSSNWRLQMGSIADATDHNAFNTDAAANSTIATSPKLWSSNTPLVVELVSFTATPSRNGILLKWETASEIDNAGFHIWRSDTAEGTYAQITDQLIPAQGGPTSGAAYNYEDTDVAQGKDYFYKLEVIDTKGASEFLGPVSASSGKATAVPTLSQWGVIALFLVLGSGAFLALRRRQFGTGH